MLDKQSNLLVVKALEELADSSSNEIISEHAGQLANEFSGLYDYTVEEPLQHLRYDFSDN